MHDAHMAEADWTTQCSGPFTTVSESKPTIMQPSPLSGSLPLDVLVFGACVNTHTPLYIKCQHRLQEWTAGYLASRGWSESGP